MTDKNILDLPEAVAVDSTTYIHQSRGGIDQKIPADKLINQSNSFPTYTLTPKEESSTSRLLTMSDRRAYIKCLSDFQTVLTVPSDIVAGWDGAVEIDVRKGGQGNVLVVGDGATINRAPGGFSLIEVGQRGKLLRVGPNEWDWICNGIFLPLAEINDRVTEINDARITETNDTRVEE